MHKIPTSPLPTYFLFHSLVSTLGALPLGVGYLSQDCSDHSKQKMLVVVEEMIWQLHIWETSRCNLFIQELSGNVARDLEVLAFLIQLGLEVSHA